MEVVEECQHYATCGLLWICFVVVALQAERFRPEAFPDANPPSFPTNQPTGHILGVGFNSCHDAARHIHGCLRRNHPPRCAAPNLQNEQLRITEKKKSPFNRACVRQVLRAFVRPFVSLKTYLPVRSLTRSPIRHSGGERSLFREHARSLYCEPLS